MQARWLLLALLATCGMPAQNRQDRGHSVADQNTLTALQPVYGSWNGTANVFIPFTGNLPGATGDFLTGSCSAPGWMMYPASMNPAPATVSGWAWGPVGPSGQKGSCGYADNDDPTQNAGFSLNAVALGTDGANNAQNVSEPVSTATGELVEPGIPPDLSLGGPLPLEFRRYYASLIGANGIGTKLGNNWTHNFEWLLILNGPFAQVVRPDAKIILFQQSGSTWQLVTTEQYDYQFTNGINNSCEFLDPRTNLVYTFAGTASTLGLSKIQDRNGNTLTVTISNGSAQVTDGLGRSLSFTYDPSSGNLIKVSDQGGRAVSLAYANGNLTQVTDANGKIVTYSYTSTGAISGLITSRKLPLGNEPWTQTFDSVGRVATQSDSRGNTTTFTYDPPAGSTSYKNPLGVVMSQASRVYADFLSFTDPDGQTISAAYDTNDRRNSVTDRLGDKTTRTYHNPSGFVASETNASGNTTALTWTAQTSGGFTFYNLTQIQYADGTSAAFGYDSNGNLMSMADQLGKVWKFAYNNRGQVTSATDPIGRASNFAYNSDATLASATDAVGNTSAYAYDSLKRLTKVTFADGSAQSFTYDSRDNLIKTTDERANTATLTYNDNNRLATMTDPLGKTSATAYDTDEQVSKITDRAGQSFGFAYNALDLLQTVTTAAGESYNVSYDTHDRLSQVVDSLGKGPSFGYDKEDVPASATDALSRKTSLVTDNLGYTTQVTTPLAENYSIARDKMERITSITDPAGIASGLSYDGRGALSVLSIGGLSSSFTRDDSGLLTAVTDPNGGAWNFKPDAAGRIGSRSDPLNRSTTYSYDSRNRPTGIQTPLGTLALTYDAAGNLTERKYSDGTDLTYAYDADDRLVSATGVTLAYDAEARITNSNGLTIARDADGRIESITYASGKTVTYTYNSQGLLTGVSDWVGGSTTLAYDAALELITLTRPNKLATHFAYDADGRIASIGEDAGSSIAITRDGAGKVVSENRTLPASANVTPNLAPGTLPLNFDAADQVSGFTYDAMGRVITDALHSYTWDLASRMTLRSGVDGSATAAYDAFGMRTSNGTQTFVWNYETDLSSRATVQSGGADQTYYVYLPGGMLLYAIDAATNARTFFHFDENGSTVLLTNDAGSVTDTYAITPYGETTTQNGSTQNPFTWLGAFGVMQEGSTGLYYMHARYYDSTTARFLSPDPIFSADPTQVNPYQYASANPMQRMDPMGTQDVDPYDPYRPFLQLPGTPTAPWATPPNPGSNFFWLADPLAPRIPGVSYPFRGLRFPDSYTLSVGVPTVYIPGVGLHFDFTIDRYGTGYIGGGPAVGVGANSFGGSIMGTWLLQDSAPSQEDLSGFITGWSGGIQGGHGIGGGYVFSPWAPRTRHGLELGLTTPGIAVSGAYTFSFSDIRNHFSGNPQLSLEDIQKDIDEFHIIDIPRDYDPGKDYINGWNDRRQVPGDVPGSGMIVPAPVRGSADFGHPVPRKVRPTDQVM